MDTKSKDKKYFTRGSSEGIEIVEAVGCRIIDSKGTSYIDLVMGWCVGNLGWKHPQIEKELKKFEGPEYVLPGFIYKPWADLAELLAQITPGNLSKCYRTTGGTESVEAAFQIAMAATDRKGLISIEGAYHGNSIATLSIGGGEGKEHLTNSLSHCHTIKTPLNKKTLGRVENFLMKKNIAALIMEPYICNLALEIPDADFMEGIRKLCTKYGTLLIIDEVATGFGRTGKFFGSQHFNIKPDIICMGKAISAGCGAMGAVITTPDIEKRVKGKVNIYSTYGWHPRSVHAALATIRFMIDHEESLMQNVNEMSAKFVSAIQDLQFKNKVNIKAKGLVISVKTNDEKYAHQIKEKCKKKGLLITVQEDNLVLFPALNISKQDVEEAIQILEKCI